MSRKINIGGKKPLEGWEILNAVAAPGVDHVQNAKDLSRFDDNCFSDLYASHVVEHLDFNGELTRTLKEWHRVLEPNGSIFISVPDLDVLCRLFLDKQSTSFQERHLIMAMMFGGHSDEYDYHMVGLNEESLSNYLQKAGFTDVERVEEFGIFADTSTFRFKGQLISVNLKARKPEARPRPGSGSNSAVRRNDPCPCGSGRKFKHCHGKAQ